MNMDQLRARDRIEAGLYLGANVIGVIIILIIMGTIRQFRDSEQRLDYDFGDSLNFLMTGFPLLILYALANSVLAVRAFWAVLKRKTYTQAIVFSAIVLLWLAAYALELSLG